MKSIIALFAVLGIASIGFSADAAKPAEGKAKPDPEAVFKKKDANNDGKLSKEEFMKGVKDENKAKMEAGFTAKDKDKDGNLTLEEYKAKPEGKKKKAA